MLSSFSYSQIEIEKVCIFSSSGKSVFSIKSTILSKTTSLSPTFVLKEESFVFREELVAPPSLISLAKSSISLIASVLSVIISQTPKKQNRLHNFPAQPLTNLPRYRNHNQAALLLHQKLPLL